MAFRFNALSLLVLIIAALPGIAGAQTWVCFETSEGDICMDLLFEAAPNTVANFLRYVNDGDFDETLVHRSVPGFVIQGGGFSFRESSFLASIPLDPPINNEFSRSNVRGTVAMARIGGNPNSATSQWFINLANNAANLDTVDGGFTVFAEVVLGMDVVDTIAGYRVNNFASQLGAVFTAVPVNVSPQATVVDLEDFVVVHRAYATDVLPYQCSAGSPGDTLTEFCGSTLSFPVSVNGQLYEGTLRYRPDLPGVAFEVDRNLLTPLADRGQNRAQFSGGVLVIPDVRIGAKVYDNVSLLLTNAAALEFTVQTFTLR